MGPGNAQDVEEGFIRRLGEVLGHLSWPQHARQFHGMDRIVAEAIGLEQLVINLGQGGQP